MLNRLHPILFRAMMLACGLHMPRLERFLGLQVTIEDKELEMLQALRQFGGTTWHDRQELAAALSKKRLNPVEIVALDLLVSAGKTEKELHVGNQPHVLRWVYRIKQ